MKSPMLNFSPMRLIPNSGKVDSMAMTLEKSALIKNWVAQPKEPHRIVSNKEIFDIA